MGLAAWAQARRRLPFGDRLVRHPQHQAAAPPKAGFMYALTKANLQQAIQRAAWLKANFSRLPGNEAYTDIDELTQRSVTLRD